MNALRPFRRLYAGWLVALAACGGAASAEGPQPAAVTYTLGPKSVVQKLYPDAGSLPQPYAANFSDLARTIEYYTRQSLARDGVPRASVKVSIDPADEQAQVRVTISPANAVTRQYARVHPAFMDEAHAQAGQRAVEA